MGDIFGHTPTIPRSRGVGHQMVTAIDARVTTTNTVNNPNTHSSWETNAPTTIATAKTTPTPNSR